jgi:hypothetical protein
MKALPIILLLVAVCFAVVEYEHGKLHRAIASNDHARIVNIQRPPEAGPPHPVQVIKPDLIGVGAKAERYVTPKPIASRPPSPEGEKPTNISTEVAGAKEGADADNKVLNDADQRMFYMRVAITAIIFPLCIWIILSKDRYKDKDRGFACATIGAVVTFWLHT